MLNSYLDIDFDALHAATNNRYVDDNGIRLVNLGPIALFSNYKLIKSSRKHLEDISHAHIVSLMYKIKIALKILIVCVLVLINIVEGGETS